MLARHSNIHKKAGIRIAGVSHMHFQLDKLRKKYSSLDMCEKVTKYLQNFDHAIQNIQKQYQIKNGASTKCASLTYK